jgi:Protein of unknown function (DUF2946)
VNAFRLHLHMLNRLALLAMVALALLPTLAQAFAQARGGHAMTEICTPQGMKLVVLDADDAASPVDAAQSALGHLDHCPFCATAAHAMAPPPEPQKLLLQPTGAEAAPLFLKAPRTLHAWVAAHPRGPPAVS